MRYGVMGYEKAESYYSDQHTVVDKAQLAYFQSPGGGTEIS